MPVDPQFVSAVSDLHVRGVQGACLLHGDTVVTNHIPKSDATVDALCAVVNAMSRGYGSVGRCVSEYYFGYDGGVVAVFVQDEWRLILCGEPTEDPEAIARTGRGFWETHACLDRFRADQTPFMAAR